MIALFLPAGSSRSASVLGWPCRSASCFTCAPCWWTLLYSWMNVWFVCWNDRAIGVAEWWERPGSSQDSSCSSEPTLVKVCYKQLRVIIQTNSHIASIQDTWNFVKKKRQILGHQSKKKHVSYNRFNPVIFNYLNSFFINKCKQTYWKVVVTSMHQSQIND